MTKFYRVCDDSFRSNRYPWAQKILGGLELDNICYTCDIDGHALHYPRGPVTVELDPHKGRYWPDVLGCGSWSLFIVSRRVLDDWTRDGIGTFPVEPAEIVGRLPPKLADSKPPEYFWLDGARMHGADIDFEASGFVGVQFCSECGNRTDDLSATYDRQHSGVWPIAINRDTWNGANLFTTDLSPMAYFCTEKVVDSARRHKHLNFMFVPSEIAASPADGIKYL